MKKIILTSMLFLLVLTFGSCATKDITTKDVATKNVTTKNITANKSGSIDKFEYFYRGFVPMNVNKMDTYPGTLIIETDEDWHDFMNKYVPGIPYNTEIDFSKDCLVFSSLFPAKPFYSIGADIKAFVVNGNKLEPEFIEHGTMGVANGIYAQNIDDIIHGFVNIVKINRSDIPKNIENIYHKK